MEIDDGDRLVSIIRGDTILAIMAHVNAPRIFAYPDDLHHLVLTGIDDADDSQIRISRI